MGSALGFACQRMSVSLSGHWPGGRMSNGRSGVVSETFATWMGPFRTSFTAPTWQRVLVLVTGALLVPDRRTVASALRVLGMAGTPHFSNYHRVLNRDRWCSRSLSRCLLRLLVAALAHISHKSQMHRGSE